MRLWQVWGREEATWGWAPEGRDRAGVRSGAEPEAECPPALWQVGACGGHKEPVPHAGLLAEGGEGEVAGMPWPSPHPCSVPKSFPESPSRTQAL